VDVGELSGTRAVFVGAGMAGCRFILQPGMTTRMKARRAFLFVELGIDAIFYTAETWVDPSGFSTYH
jgi:hypothetical protein